jgi:transcriptional regulator with XRE-family HTH domain
VPQTPKRAGREPQPESKFPSQVLAANVASLRALRGIRQEELAERMRLLRHGWSRATVSEVERGDRNVTVDELGSLAIALNAPLTELLDPDRQNVALDVGFPVPIPVGRASAWVRGLLRIGRGVGEESDKYVIEETLDQLEPGPRVMEFLRMRATRNEEES